MVSGALKVEEKGNGNIKSAPGKGPIVKDALGRQVWNKQYYADRAALRVYEDGSGVKKEEKKTLKRVEVPASERRPLQQRDDEVVLEADIGTMRMVTAQTPQAEQGGFYCDLCHCLIKDSQAYLDHINGRRHNRLLGMTMNVERVPITQVKGHLNEIKMAQEDEKRKKELQVDDDDGLKRLLLLEEEERKRKRELKEAKKKKKKKRESDEEAEPLTSNQIEKLFATLQSS